MSGVAMGLGSPAGRDGDKVGTLCSRSRRLGRDALELGQPLPRGAGRSCGKHDTDPMWPLLGNSEALGSGATRSQGRVLVRADLLQLGSVRAGCQYVRPPGGVTLGNR
jgi:hypothetical protein